MCNLETVLSEACTSNIGKVQNPVTLLQIIAQLLCVLQSSLGSQPLVYRAILNQSGTGAPVATVLENTIGNIVWSRGSTGNYTGLLAGSFPASSTLINQGFTDWNNLQALQVSVNAPDTIGIGTFDISSFPAVAPADDVMGALGGFPLQILVYP